jgi:hypothetical protein
LLEDFPPILLYGGFAALGLWVLLSLWIIVRRGFLALAAGRDFHHLVLLVLLPVLFELTNGFASKLLGKTPYLSETGQDVLAIVLVLLLLQPLQAALTRLITWITVPGLRDVARTVDSTLEVLGETADPATAAAEATRVFAEQGLDRYALYRRDGAGRLVLLVDRLGEAQGAVGSQGVQPQEMGRLPREIPLSDALRRHLGERPDTVLDLQQVPGQWAHYFAQFELGRLEALTGCRYLLPIRLGTSLRGLLLLPGGEEVQAPPLNDLEAAEYGKLGVVLVESGRTPLELPRS